MRDLINWATLLAMSAHCRDSKSPVGEERVRPTLRARIVANWKVFMMLERVVSVCLVY